MAVQQGAIDIGAKSVEFHTDKQIRNITSAKGNIRFLVLLISSLPRNIFFRGGQWIPVFKNTPGPKKNAAFSLT